MTALVLLALFAAETREEAVTDYLEAARIDPTDPTRFDPGFRIGAEWVNLSRGEGDLILFHLAGSQPLGGREQFLVEIDLPFGFSDTEAAGSAVGFGDLRLAAAWRPWEAKDPDRGFAAFSLRADVLFPTGSGSRSLGADDWVVAPSASFKWRWRAVSIYLTGRWIHGSGVNVAGIRWFNVPGVDAASNATSRTDLDALNVELSFAWNFESRESPVHWFAITPDWTSNLSGDRNDVIILKTRLGRTLSDHWSFNLDFWFPITGERTQSFTLNFAFVWNF